MFKRLFLLSITCAIAITAIAQVSTVYVNEKKLDNDAVQAIQTIQPGFSLYGDSAAIAANTLKFYTLNKYLAEKVSAVNIDTSKVLLEKIALAKQVLEQKILAEEYISRQLSTINATTQEGEAYYKAHLEQFSISGNRNFFVAQTSDTSAKTLKEIKQFVAEKKASRNKGDTKVVNDTYFITYSNYYSNNKQAPLYNEITLAKQDTWIGPYSLSGTNGFFYYYIMDGTPETHTPYEQVKDICLQNVRNQKVAALQYEWSLQAQKMYAVKVSATNSPNTK